MGQANEAFQALPAALYVWIANGRRDLREGTGSRRDLEERARKINRTGIAMPACWICAASPGGSGRPSNEPMTVDDFRRIALSLEGAEESSHMGSPDFRVGWAYIR